MQQQRSWGDYDGRVVEELDTDDDNSPQGVELYGQPRHRSDELHFTGIDLGAGRVRGRSGEAYDDFTPSEDEDEYEYDVQTGLVRRHSTEQQILKEKEELLVQRAMDRIARARALGKPNVRLSRAEIDALERAERNQASQRPSAAPKAAPSSKKEVVKRKPVELRKGSSKSTTRSASDSPTKGKPGDTRGRGKSNSATNSARESRENSVTYASRPEDFEVARRPPYPQGYPSAGSRERDTSGRGSRTNSNQSLRQYPQAMAPPQHPYYANRYSSNPDPLYGNRPGSNSSRSSRPDPAEMDWEPRARSTSSLVNMPLDQLPYQTSVGRAPRFDPSDPRFASPRRRVASGPPAILQQQGRPYHRPQDELFLPDDQPEVYNYLASPRSDAEVDHDEYEDDDDSDYDAGVEVVDVSERPGGNYAIQTRSATAAAASPAYRGRANTGKSTAGKSKRGR